MTRRWNVPDHWASDSGPRVRTRMTLAGVFSWLNYCKAESCLLATFEKFAMRFKPYHKGDSLCRQTTANRITGTSGNFRERDGTSQSSNSRWFFGKNRTSYRDISRTSFRNVSRADFRDDTSRTGY